MIKVEEGDSPVCVRKGYHDERYQGRDKPDRCASCGKYEKPEYPVVTTMSPRVTTVERIGKVISVGGKKKFKAVEPKPLPPLKHDTLSGYGEKRRRYIR